MASNKVSRLLKRKPTEAGPPAELAIEPARAPQTHYIAQTRISGPVAGLLCSPGDILDPESYDVPSPHGCSWLEYLVNRGSIKKVEA